MTGEFPAQMASIAENVSIWWRHFGDNYCSIVSDAIMTNMVKIFICDKQWSMYNQNKNNTQPNNTTIKQTLVALANVLLGLLINAGSVFS